MRLNLSLLAVAVFTAFATLLTSTPASAAVQCASADTSSMILTLDDFGRSKSVYSEPLKNFSDGNGSQTWYVYGRGDWVEMSNNPYGAFMYGVVASSKDPGKTYQELLGKELGKWDAKEYWQVDASPRGDEMAVYQRLTTWEMFSETPMVETLIAMRRGCVVSVMNFVTMDEHKPKAQADRYAGLMLKRIS